MKNKNSNNIRQNYLIKLSHSSRIKYEELRTKLGFSKSMKNRMINN